MSEAALRLIVNYLVRSREAVALTDYNFIATLAAIVNRVAAGRTGGSKAAAAN